MTTSPDSFSTHGVDGVRIVADRLGDPLAPAVVFLHGGGQTRRSWGRAAAAVAERGWQAVTVDFRGHGESDWSDDGDYRVTTSRGTCWKSCASFRRDLSWSVPRLVDSRQCFLRESFRRAAVRAVVLVDIVPDMNQSGATRIHSFMNDRMTSGFASLDEVADAIQEYNPNRGRPTDLDGLRPNLRLRDGRWYWHWDPKFIDGTSALPPIEVTEVDRMHAAVEAILRNGVPMLLVRGQMSDLVTKEKADEFIARFPEIDFVDVGGAGHMVAGDRNDHFAGAVVEFLARHAQDE